jgi:hypothetical protein
MEMSKNTEKFRIGKNLVPLYSIGAAFSATSLYAGSGSLLYPSTAREVKKKKKRKKKDQKILSTSEKVSNWVLPFLLKSIVCSKPSFRFKNVCGSPKLKNPNQTNFG